MELDNDTIAFMAHLGKALDALEPNFPDHVNVKIAVEWHGEQIATWGSEGGATVWHMGGDE